MQMLAPIRRDACIENVVMAAFDDVDGINLQVAKVRYRCRSGLRAGAEGFDRAQALGMQPDSAGLDRSELDRRILQSASLPKELSQRMRRGGPTLAYSLRRVES